MPQISSHRARVPRWMCHAADALAGIFLPADCRVCEKPLMRAARLPICDACLGSCVRIGGNICVVCGLPLESFEGSSIADPAVLPLFQEPGSDAAHRCAACRLGVYRFDRARSVFRYENEVVRAVVLLKFEEMDPLADWLAEELARTAGADDLGNVDVVVPVPLHKVRQRERGFNQAELLAKRVAKRLKRPHQGILLVRKKPRPDKQLLTEHERWEAVRGAFATRAGSLIDKKRVLLVDDVMTTGATLDACAKALREAGAAVVNCVTVARAVARRPRRTGK